MGFLQLWVCDQSLIADGHHVCNAVQTKQEIWLIAYICLDVWTNINKINSSWHSVWTKALEQTVEQSWKHKMLTVNKEHSFCKHEKHLPFGCWFRSATLDSSWKFRVSVKKSSERGKVTWDTIWKIKSKFLLFNFSPFLPRRHSRSLSCKKQLKLMPGFSQLTWAATPASMTWRLWWKPGGTDCPLFLMTCPTGAASSCGVSTTTKVRHTDRSLTPVILRHILYLCSHSCFVHVIRVLQGPLSCSFTLILTLSSW